MIIHHQPVFKDFILENLLQVQDKVVLDATLGEGGHTLSFLEQEKHVIAFERDPHILKFAEKRLASFIATKQLNIKQANYKDINILVKDPIDFALFDLGISKFHYKAGKRGFSFQEDETLDMRLDIGDIDLLNEQTKEVASVQSAQKIINTWEEEDLANLFYKYGEETLSRPCARLIVKIRETKPITTSLALAELIKRVYAKKNIHSHNHPATKVFQALRIMVNHELDYIQEGLTGTIDLLAPQGRIAVIAYHSLEDRMVKETFKQYLIKRKNVNKYLVPETPEIEKSPLEKSSLKKQFVLENKKIIRPDKFEISENPAARSACLRVLVRTV